MSTTDGYAIQRAWADLRAERGERLVGYKVGFTSKSMQRTYNVDKPLVGRLFDSMMWKTGDSLDSRHFYKPHVEVELAFIMGRDLACGAVTLAAVLAATAFIQPALELIDYRTGMPRSIADMVADNTACAGAVLGGQRIPPAQLDLTWIAATIAKNGEIEETGVSAAVLGHPARAVVALSDQLALEQCHIKAGDIILSGSFTPMIAVAGGDVVHADFGQLGSIDLTLA